MTVPGIGPIISSAMVAAIGTGDVFSKGRDFGAWLGLVPKQISTGDRTILGSISKRGNRYLRALFVQAAWVVLVKVGPKHWERYGLKSWIEAAKKVCITTCWQLRSPTNLHASPGVFLPVAEPSRRASFKSRNNLPAEVCERMRRDGGRSSRRMRTLVTRMAR